MKFQKMSGQQMRVLVVDDHPVFLDALRSILEAHFDAIEVTCLQSVEEAVAFSGKIDEFSLAIVDLSFRGKDVTRHICSLIEDNPTAKFLVLTNFEDDRHIRAVSEAGAHGYLPKSSGTKILTSVVQLIAAGGRYFPQDDRKSGGGPLNSQANSDGRAHSLLSTRQKEIFEQLAAGTSIAELAENLRVSEPTIKADIAKATRSLDARNRLHAVCRAIEIGLIHPNLD